MTNRTNTALVTFLHPFVLDGLDGTQPAGTYQVETEEALLQSLSFPVWQRLWTTIRFEDRRGNQFVASIDPAALEAALSRDVAEV